MIQGKTVAALIVAAGSSARMGFDKLQAKLDGQTVLQKSILAFHDHPAIDEIILVTSLPKEQALAFLKARQHIKPFEFVAGGETRAHSVQNGLRATTADYIAIHDAARPFVTPEIITQTLETAMRTGAAAPAVAVKDTIKVAQHGIVTQTPARASLYAVQTPQCFCTQQYRAALKQADLFAVTDDCSVMEQSGFAVTLTQGSYTNYKITTPEDLLRPQEASRMRIGHGYDVHKLVDKRRFILGGVEIPYEKGLLGHSDADVLVHAIMDALLGAAALGDIGKHFPDTDIAYAGADSIVLLQKVAQLLQNHGYAVENVDVTVLCQKPKLAPYIDEMRKNIAHAIGVELQDVSVKATTEEGLGFTGAGQGVAAHSVCLLKNV